MAIKHHIVIRIGDKDTFSPHIQEGESSLVLCLDTSGHAYSLPLKGLWKTIDQHRLSPVRRAVDLFRLTSSIFSADVRTSRHNSAFDSWSREFVVYMPVGEAEIWQSNKEIIETLANFLTGDKWVFVFRTGGIERPPIHPIIRKKAKKPTADAVCLLSGGLDSFIGAVDSLAEDEPLVLVSHHGVGSSSHASPAQKKLAALLKNSYKHIELRHLQFYVSPPKQAGELFEDTTRSRSIIFLGLGTLIASSLRESSKLLVPENGLISLNPPLTYSRLGSLSTRTTHPNVLKLFQDLIDGLGLGVSLLNPYQFKTKGEMLLESKNFGLLRQHAKDTMSCASPTKSRFKGKGPMHCGHCVPCIIRRASTTHADVRDADYDIYVEKDKLTPATKANSEAFKMAIHRLHINNSTTSKFSLLTDVLSTGPLHASPTQLEKYTEVYRRGLKEVSKLLN